jgi:hypothetical protein
MRCFDRQHCPLLEKSQASRRQACTFLTFCFSGLQRANGTFIAEHLGIGTPSLSLSLFYELALISAISNLAQLSLLPVPRSPTSHSSLSPLSFPIPSLLIMYRSRIFSVASRLAPSSLPLALRCPPFLRVLSPPLYQLSHPHSF